MLKSLMGWKRAYLMSLEKSYIIGSYLSSGRDKILILEVKPKKKKKLMIFFSSSIYKIVKIIMLPYFFLIKNESINFNFTINLDF